MQAGQRQAVLACTLLLHAGRRGAPGRQRAAGSPARPPHPLLRRCLGWSVGWREGDGRHPLINKSADRSASMQSNSTQLASSTPPCSRSSRRLSRASSPAGRQPRAAAVSWVLPFLAQPYHAQHPPEYKLMPSAALALLTASATTSPCHPASARQAQGCGLSRRQGSDRGSCPAVNHSAYVNWRW